MIAIYAAGKGRDPLAALANVQRGALRVAKGLTTGNFSEIEGGRRAVIRGVVKGSKGDLQEKKELQKLIAGTVAVGAVFRRGWLRRWSSSNAKCFSCLPAHNRCANQ